MRIENLVLYTVITNTLARGLISLMAILTLASCHKLKESPEFTASSHLPQYDYQSGFDEYVAETKAWLLENRAFKTKNRQRELEANLPFELTPTHPNNKSVLLVHGLGDSPFSFTDVASHLVSKGYFVRAILLPGHGSKVADLNLATLDSWKISLQHHIELLKSTSEEVWLGGFSTGANLVTAAAYNDEDIAGLILFSPAFEARSRLLAFSKYAKYFITWADRDEESNYLRYNSLPMHAAAMFYETVLEVREKMSSSGFARPVFILASANDSIIDTQFLRERFSQSFTHPGSRLIWQGDDIGKRNPRILTYSMNLPELRIANGSHMGVLFAPDNPEYGVNGKLRICDNGQSQENQILCESGADTWRTAYGGDGSDNATSRLTFNPYFAEHMEVLDWVMASDSDGARVVESD
ncbi:alpha/beta fold hydrolase [Hahella sp. KA22]|uniref:alpha/beta hydrolase n=1 Tax=Hahella sp. KA22 TaxID=1628392 RepID=UPI000FDE1497|nr:alpha/beta fold hydrolase [Hahella sp. KA22]AZZ92458.1 alpha/beta fold hydrolase [Hahella sp. KA22]QAY55832.1 alpha/beta fold hydrolase [Hahella sp. KA22]